ncbi:hypothetical protein ACJX0J_007840, partial [Zea mays]
GKASLVVRWLDKHHYHIHHLLCILALNPDHVTATWTRRHVYRGLAKISMHLFKILDIVLHAFTISQCLMYSKEDIPFSLRDEEDILNIYTKNQKERIFWLANLKNPESLSLVTLVWLPCFVSHTNNIGILSEAKVTCIDHWHLHHLEHHLLWIPLERLELAEGLASNLFAAVNRKAIFSKSGIFFLHQILIWFSNSFL